MGYRRTGESGLSTLQVFFITRLVVTDGQRLPRVPCPQALRRDASQPLQIQPHGRRNRLIFPATGWPWQTLPVVRGKPAVLDTIGVTRTFRRTSLVADREQLLRPANRELRCDSGTAPPLCPGDSRGWFCHFGRESRLRSRHCLPVAQATGRREGKQPAEPGSQKTYQCSRGARVAARAAPRARPTCVGR